MATFITSFVSVLLSIVMFLSTPLCLITGAKEKRIQYAEDGCKLSFAAISDIHLRDMWGFQEVLELGLKDMSKAKDRLDAVAFVGDITDHGYIEMWDRFADATSKYDYAKNSLVVVGNHDTWGPNRDDFSNPVDGVKTTFIKYNKIVSDRDISEMYYSDVINGYYFIALGSEEDHTSANLTQTQLDWFANEMKKASETGLPIFVFLHQPVIGTHGLPYNWEVDENCDYDDGGIGEENDQVVAILKKYDNVFFISGHIHAGFKNADQSLGVDYASVEYMENDNGNNVTLINLPSYMYFDFLRGGHLMPGCGWIVEAYEDKVLIRGRNFATGTYISKYDVEVPLV